MAQQYSRRVIFNLNFAHIMIVVNDTKRKEGRKCLFNNTLNTFYIQLYGVGHMVKDHSDSEKGNPLLPLHGLLFLLNSSKGYFKCTIPQKR